MKLVISEPEIEKLGFQNDLFNVDRFGEKFTNLVNKFEGPLVVALDGDWGSGKSVFLKMWKSEYENKTRGTAKFIYFDAFKHDFLDDPLVSLVGAIASEKEKSFSKSALKKLKSATIPLARSSARVGLAVASAGLSELTGPIVDAAIRKSEDLADQKVEDFWSVEASRIIAMEKFETSLSNLTSNGKKVVLIIDELDRCRPDYALTFLETIKHFFAVPNLIFVLGVNMRSLENSVRSRYGMSIDASGYLRKFIHLSTTLPISATDFTSENKATTYMEHLFRKNSFENLWTEFQEIFEKRSEVSELSLRDAERIYALVQLLPNGFERHFWGIRHVVLTAAIAKIVDPLLYQKMLKCEVVIGDIGEFYNFQKFNYRMLTSEQNESNHFEHLAFSVWARLLSPTPNPEVVEQTRNAFPNFRNQLAKKLVGIWIRQYLEHWKFEGEDSSH